MTDNTIPQDSYKFTLDSLTDAPPAARHTIPTLPFKFTLPRLESLPPGGTSPYIVRDAEQQGLCCRVHPPSTRHPQGDRTLMVAKKPKGSRVTVRVSICAVGELPMTALKGKASVRSRADEITSQLRLGIDPNQVAKAERAAKAHQGQVDAVANITLGQAFEKSLEIQPIAARTLAGYRLAIDRDLATWKDRPLREITGAMAVTRHAELTQGKGNPLRAMQVLRKVHRFATQFWGTDDNELPFGRCPVDKVNVVHRQWAKTAPRTRKLGDADLGPWLKAVRDLPHTQQRGDGQLAAHYLELMLLTGLRRREAAFLKWADVDFRRLTLTVRHTKNKTDHTLPITKRVKAILTERQSLLIAAQDLAKRRPNPTNKAHADDLAQYVIGLEETRHQIALIEAQTGILVGAHDLRRSWASLADRCGVGAYTIKGVLNHANASGDVTGNHYCQPGIDDLRQPMQTVENYILAKLAAANGENVIPLHPVREVAA